MLLSTHISRWPHNKDLPLADSSVFEKSNNITYKLCENDGSIFKKFISGEITYKKPDGTPGFYIKSEHCVGLQGIGIDHANIFHMLIIPKKSNIRWCKDLKNKDIPLLLHMKQVGLQWIDKNRPQLQELWNKNDEIPIQFGFHTQPTVGYLHMHMLVGHLTEEGAKYKDKWISLQDVVNELLLQ